jgi:glutaredoxin
MKKSLTLFFSIVLAIFLLVSQVEISHAQTPTPQQHVIIYLFWGEGCPHCAKAKPYFEKLATIYPEIQLHSYEVYYDAENQKLFSLMAEKYGLEQLAVPTIFIGDKYLQGYSEEYNSSIEAVVVQCIQNDCGDPGLGVIDTMGMVTSTPDSSKPITPSPMPEPTKTPTPTQSNISLTDPSSNLNQSHDLKIPIFGKLDLDSKSPIITTALIALVDGFNPCSLWVLTMLLALTLHTGSRKKVFTIGIIFLTVTAGIYALFIAGLFSILKITSAMGWIRIFVAMIALFFALVNIKDYFWYKEGISFTIADEKKPGIFKRMRAVMDASQSFSGLVGATIALAVGVSMVEFSCTAGFPVIWTNILAAQKISGVAFVLLLIVYMVIYQLDEMIIFFSSVATLKASRLEEKHGRVLKLISGMLMATLSIIMLVNPSLLNNLLSSLAIFGVSILATLLVLIIHKLLLPTLGIKIGNK